ncbi:hypothetical protein JCM8547_008592 [Rhodosporidiobolus lusitaniae]
MDAPHPHLQLHRAPSLSNLHQQGQGHPQHTQNSQHYGYPQQQSQQARQGGQPSVVVRRPAQANGVSQPQPQGQPMAQRGPGGQMLWHGGQPGGPGGLAPHPQAQRPPGQLVGPNHPQHPQHHLWLQQQQQQQYQGPPGGGGPPPGQPNYLPHPPPLAQTRLPPPQNAPSPLPIPPQSHQQGSVAPPARVIPSQASMRGGLPPPPSPPLPPGAAPNPPPLRMNGVGGPHSGPPSAVYAPSPQHQHAAIVHRGPPPQQQQQLPRPPQPPQQQQQFLPPSQPGPPGPPPGFQQHLRAPPTPVQQQPQQNPQLPLPPAGGIVRPVVRPSMVSPPASTLLAAHLAIHGTGPITATAAPAGPALSRLAALNDAVIQASEYANPLEALRSVIAEHFTDTGVVKVGLYDKNAQLSKIFEIPCSAWPRFQHLNFLHGVVGGGLSTTFAREYRLTTPDPSCTPSPSSPSSDPPRPPPASFPIHIGYLLRAEDATWSSRFTSGTKIDLVGTLTMHLMFKDLGTGAAGLRIESLEFESRGHEEWVAREAMEAFELSGVVGKLRTGSLSGALTMAAGGVAKDEDKEGAGGKEGKDRPKGKKGKKEEPPPPPSRGMVTRRKSASARELSGGAGIVDGEEEQGRKRENSGESSARRGSGDEVEILKQEGEDEIRQGMRNVRVPVSPVGTFGVTEMGMRCLEIAESVAQLQDLIAFSLDTGIGPVESLARFADRHRATYYANGAPTPLASGPPPPATPGGGPPPVHPSQQQQQQPQLHDQPQQPPIAASHQNPSTNSFYSSVTASPGPGQNLALNSGGRRPGSGGGPMNGMGGLGGEDLASSAGGPAGAAGKRKLSGNGPANGDAGSPPEDDPGSPQKMQRVGGGGGGRGRGRGR